MVDKLLDHCGGNRANEERAMDSNEHEKERGITISSKYTRLHYKDCMLHIVDTPGHADFGGEVERILNMVDGVILLVDATEGPMSQTKFVLSKAIQANKKAIVVFSIGYFFYRGWFYLCYISFSQIVYLLFTFCLPILPGIPIFTYCLLFV